MMRSIIFEWKTVLRNPRFLMTVFLLLAGNLLLLFETDLFVHETYVVTEREKEAYDDFLRQIPEQASVLRRQTLYQDEETFRRRNLEKTVTDYARLMDSKENGEGPFFTVGSYRALLGYACYWFSPLFILAFCLLAAWTLVTEERRKGLFLLLKSTKKGQGRLALVKTISAMTMAFTFTILLEASDILFLSWRHGLPELKAALWSLPLFRDCALPISMAEGVLVTIIFRLLICGLLTCFCMAVFFLLRQDFMALFLIICGCLAEMILCLSTPLESKVKELKVLNIFYLSDMRKLLANYVNLDFFGIPVGAMGCGAVVVLISTWIFALAATRGFQRICQISEPGIVERLTERLRMYLHFFGRQGGIICYEWKKIFFKQKKGFVFLLLAFYAYAAGRLALQPETFAKAEDAEYSLYIKELTGVVTSNTRARIAALKNEADALYEEAKAEPDALVRESRMEYAQGKIAALQKIAAQAGSGKDPQTNSEFEDAYLINTEAYTEMFCDVKGSLLSFLIAGMAILAFGAGAESYDRQSGMDGLLFSTGAGEKRIRRAKRRAIEAAACLSFMSVLVPLAIRIGKIDGLRGLGATMDHISGHENMASVSLLFFLLLVISIRLLSLLIFGRLIAAFTRIFRQEIAVCGVGALLLGALLLTFYLMNRNLPTLLLEMFGW